MGPLLGCLLIWFIRWTSAYCVALAAVFSGLLSALCWWYLHLSHGRPVACALLWFAVTGWTISFLALPRRTVWGMAGLLLVSLAPCLDNLWRYPQAFGGFFPWALAGFLTGTAVSIDLLVSDRQGARAFPGS